MKKSKELKPKYTGSLQKTTTKKMDATNVAPKGLKYPALAKPAVIKISSTPKEVRMMSTMLETGDAPSGKEMEVMKSYFPGGIAEKEYTKLAKERVENNFIPTRAPKYLAKQAKKIAVKMRKAK